MKVVHVKCLRCNEPITHHHRSMQIVAGQDTPPNPGYKVNLYQCIATGGYSTGISKDIRQDQQGEGRFRLIKRQLGS